MTTSGSIRLLYLWPTRQTPKIIRLLAEAGSVERQRVLAHAALRLCRASE